MNVSTCKFAIVRLTIYVCIIIFFALHKFITFQSEIKTFEIRQRLDNRERNVQEKMTVSAVNNSNNDQSNEQNLRIIRLEEKVKTLETRLENITKILSRMTEGNDENGSVFSRLSNEILSDEYQTIKKSKDNNETSMKLRLVLRNSPN